MKSQRWARQGTAALLAAATFASTMPATRAADSQLENGIRQVQEGELEPALLTLRAAVQTLSAQAGRQRDLGRAYLWMGIAQLGLEREADARESVRRALVADPALALGASEFPPRIVRFFDEVKATTRAAASPAAPSPPAAVGPPAASTPEKKKGGKGLLIALGAVAVVGGGVAAAAGGGSSPAPVASAPPTTVGTAPTTTAPTTTSTTVPETPPTTAPPAPTTTTTPPAPPPTTEPPPTTTTTTVPSCNNLPGATWVQPNQGETLSGTRTFQCRLTAQDPGLCIRSMEYRIGPDSNDPTTCNNATAMGSGQPPDFAISYDTRQRPNGSYCVMCVPQTASANNGQSARLSIAINNVNNVSSQDRDRQRGGRALAWTSRLPEGAAGQVVVDGTHASFVDARHDEAMELSPGAHRMEALLVDAERPGVWEFELAGSLRGGSLRPLAGTAARVTERSIAFRLQGRPGERFVFLFETE